MSKFESTLILPVEDLQERRRILEKELREVVVATVFTGLKNDLQELFITYNVKEVPSGVSWEFHGEYDDEGGTDYYPNYIRVFDENGDSIELEEYKTKKKSKYSDNVYEYSLDEEIHEAVCNYREDLYEHDIEEIIF
ncbi:hypothetical protein [Bacillus sp. T33-2]|uniref:hypothetical protein n=1 Tax=Bacillus sp. T33-2 TaxID=2054168 RepID=UPI000C78E00C|nr:hypothetical protein [Bacillus sp. T33-2]PLR99527.1 hypothetical protein CVD19_00255 [Bacillus sp. T33-2]